MNVDFEFKAYAKKIEMESKQTDYEICFNLPMFKTGASEDNVAKLKFIYCPKDSLLEFHSFKAYVDQYINVPISLEASVWSILDDIFDKLQPAYAIVIVESELPDGASVKIKAQKGLQS